MTGHLVQSTLFAGVIALLALLLRKNAASVRHVLWLAASIKFLVPFSLLINLGGQVHWRMAAPAALSHVFENRGFAFATPEIHVAAPALAVVDWPVVVEAAWLLGGAIVLANWAVRWGRVRRTVRAASPLELSAGIKAMSTPALLEPGVFGILRPVLLLPSGIAERVTREQLNAIVAHELCHVRRRDNLAAAIHMVVEAVFWFHPLVWWIGSRLVEERERACDEEVLRMGNAPEIYAESILRVCRLYLESPPACVCGVTGSDLNKRVENIMASGIVLEMGFARKLLLTGVALGAIAVPVAVGILNATPMRAQERAKPVAPLIATSALPGFEVASIKPSAPDSSLKVNFAPGGKLFVTNATLRFLIKIAYDIGDDQLAGGAGWIGSKRFDLAATPEKPLGGDPKNMAPDQILLFHKPVRLRLQRLLADRFQLELRKESTPMPIFALVVARGGPKKLTVSKSTADPQLKFANGVLNAVGVDTATLAKFLSEGQTGRPVVDMTGMKDKYDFHLEWAPDASRNSLPADSAANQQPADVGGVSIFTALQQQLGLKLEARTDAADRLVIVRAELPSAN